MPRRWTKASKLALVLLAVGTPTLALELADDRPDIIPRTDEERARITAVTAPATDFTTPEPYEARPAGAATVPLREAAPFSQPSATLPEDRKMDFLLGEALFEKLWVASPSSTRASDGLGPFYNARSCAACHVNDGRGHPPENTGDNAISFVFHLSVPDAPDASQREIEDWIATAPAPVYGRQLQDTAAPGMSAEGQVRVTYQQETFIFPDGETIELRRPDYAIETPGYGAPHPDLMLSPRIAPPMIGLGLIEAIPSEDILALADPDDADGDGISGRASIVPSLETGVPMLGRFGWKGGHASVRDQSATAFSNDIGISSPLVPTHWGDCTALETVCRDAPHGDDEARDGFEIDGDAFELVAFYADNLGVPARRDAGHSEVLRGKAMFYEAGCAACHQPKFVTHRLADDAPQSFQLIWPYSDFLLHDMGEGLADNRPEGRATGREWRTPALWGIGLTSLVTGQETYLHDGRARSLMEAILWHGGEAQAARDRVTALSKPDRDALVKFLESL